MLLSFGKIIKQCSTDPEVKINEYIHSLVAFLEGSCHVVVNSYKFLDYKRSGAYKQYTHLLRIEDLVDNSDHTTVLFSLPITKTEDIIFSIDFTLEDLSTFGIVRKCVTCGESMFFHFLLERQSFANALYRYYKENSSYNKKGCDCNEKAV